MRIPYRKPKPGELPPEPTDLHITQERYDESAITLERLITRVRPRLAEEVKRLAEMGDFSENAAYQIAKGKLRGLNSRIDKLEYQIKHAIIIRPRGTGVVELGSTVTVEINGKEKTYRILGSAEVDLDNNIISHNSPIGQALLGKRVGEIAKVDLGERVVEYRIIGIQ